MALTFTDEATANSTSSGATLALTNVDGAVGDMMLLACAADNAGTSGVSSTSATITDAAGNTWTRERETNQTAGVAADGTTLSIWSCFVTVALSAATITINFSPNTTAKAATMKRVQPGAGEAVSIIEVGAGVAGSVATQTTPAVSVTSGHTMLGFVAVENTGTITADSDTTNGTWSTIETVIALGGGATTSQALSSQRKLATGTGNQTYNTGTGGVARDYAINYVVLAAVVTDIDIEVGDGAIEIDGEIPTISIPFAVTLPAAGEIEIAGAVPATSGTKNVTPRAGGITLIGYQPTVLPDDDELIWPAQLPLPRITTHAFQPRASISRAEMEQGAARVRRRSERTPNDIPFSLICDALQQAIFEAWADHKAGYGAAWFTIDLLSPAGLAPHTVRLREPPKYKELTPTRWLVSGTFEARTRPMMTEDELNDALGLIS